MSSSIVFNLLEACREPGCPICRLEQQSVERHLENQFYENVNSPKWRDQLRPHLGFCHEHAWLGVDRRLGDALGYSIIYHDIVNSVLSRLSDSESPSRTTRHWTALLRQVPEQTRNMVAKMLAAITPRKHCPICEYRDETTRRLLSVFVEELENEQMTSALQASDGLCLPHLRLVLEHVGGVSVCEKLLTIHRARLERLQTELAEFIRKNDYQAIQEGFGQEGDAWLRAIGMIAGPRKGGR